MALCANAAEIDAGGLAMKVAEVWLSDRDAFQPAEEAGTPAGVAVSAAALTELTGAHADRGGSGPAEVLHEGEGLRLRTGEGTVDLEPLGVDHFAGATPEGPSLVLRFIRDGMSRAVLRIEVGIEEGGQLRTYEPAPTEAGAGEMSQPAGDYWSPELTALYRLRVVEGRLTLTRRRHGTVVLIPANEGSYTAPTDWIRQRPGSSIRFDRDGFRLSGGGFRNLRFDRLPGLHADGAGWLSRGVPGGRPRTAGSGARLSEQPAQRDGSCFRPKTRAMVHVTCRCSYSSCTRRRSSVRSSGSISERASSILMKPTRMSVASNDPT